MQTSKNAIGSRALGALVAAIALAADAHAGVLGLDITTRSRVNGDPVETRTDTVIDPGVEIQFGDAEAFSWMVAGDSINVEPHPNVNAPWRCEILFGATHTFVAGDVLVLSFTLPYPYVYGASAITIAETVTLINGFSEGDTLTLVFQNMVEVSQGDSGAVFDLSSNALRPAGWTSADAAGLPILPGLIRYDEVQAGEINHAIRFTVQNTRRAYVWPARHFASDSTDPNRPPMGQRFRLKASFDESPYSPEAQVVMRALKKYGMILADNGSNWHLTGEHHPLWDDDALGDIKLLKGADFEAVDVSSLLIDPDSGQAVQQNSAACPADVNGDGVVGAGDLGLVLGAWGTSASAPDIDESGVVDAADLALLLGAWGQCPD